MLFAHSMNKIQNAIQGRLSTLNSMKDGNTITWVKLSIQATFVVDDIFPTAKPEILREAWDYAFGLITTILDWKGE